MLYLKNLLESIDSLEVVLIPPNNQEIDSKEEGNNNILNEECLPDEVSDKFEIHGEAFKDKLSVTKSRCSRWRKSDEVNKKFFVGTKL